MTFRRILALALPLALLAACGGSAGNGPAAPGAASSGAAALAAAAPSIGQVELGVTPLDVAPSTQMPPPMPMPGDACNPHLLLRGEEITGRVNRHLYKVLVHVEDAVASDQAPVTTGDTATWTRSRRGVDAQLSVTRDGATTFSWALALKKTADTTWTEVASGHLDTAGAAGPHQGKGDMQLDLGKVAGVTGEDVSGTLSTRFENFADRRLVAVHADQIVWDADARRNFLRAPRSADFVSLREPGKGGSLKVSEAAAFDCPLVPSVNETRLQLVNRWYLPTTGGVHGRSDAALTGGLLPLLKVAVVEGLTCHQSATPVAEPAEGAWLVKAEDASGATLWGRQSPNGTCDPLLNQDGLATDKPIVPTLADGSTDFGFSTVVFDDGVPYPFPGM